MGNRRAVGHGLRMVNGRLPLGASWIRRESDATKRFLEREVVRVKGELSILDVATVNEAVAWERHRLLAARWLRIAHAELSHDQRLNFSREVARAATERNKALRLLGIDKRDISAWDRLAALDVQAGDPSGQDDASEGATTDASQEGRA